MLDLARHSVKLSIDLCTSFSVPTNVGSHSLPKACDFSLKFKLGYVASTILFICLAFLSSSRIRSVPTLSACRVKLQHSILTVRPEIQHFFDEDAQVVPRNREA
jgi:hypothetical protein